MKKFLWYISLHIEFHGFSVGGFLYLKYCGLILCLPLNNVWVGISIIKLAGFNENKAVFDIFQIFTSRMYILLYGGMKIRILLLWGQYTSSVCWCSNAFARCSVSCTLCSKYLFNCHVLLDTYSCLTGRLWWVSIMLMVFVGFILIFEQQEYVGQIYSKAV